MLQRKVCLPWGMFNIYPNFYIVLVGPSGSRKGTAMGPSYPFLQGLGIKLAAEAITREALIRELRQSSNTQVDPATGNVYIHSSLTVHSPEFTVFLGYQNIQLISDLCDWYDCRDRWTYRTKNMGVDEIVGVWVNILGATTPDLLQTTLPRDAIGGGLTARMIIVCEQRKGKTVTVPFLTPEELELQKVLISDLEQIYMLAGEYKITDKFLALWNSWYPAQERRPPFTDVRLASYIERRPIHVLKLSMVVCASRTNKMLLEVQDLERAIHILTTVEKKMPQAFSGIGKAKLADVLVRVWTYLAGRGEAKISELMREFHYDADVDDLGAIVRTLEAMKIIAVGYIGNNPIVQYKGTKELEEKYGIAKRDTQTIRYPEGEDFMGKHEKKLIETTAEDSDLRKPEIPQKDGGAGEET